MVLLLAGASSSASTERIVVLSPAAADVLHALGADKLVVGKTRNVKLFPKAVFVGSHIRPNVEIVASLRPTLIVASSERFFSKELAERFGAKFYLYDPYTLEGILRHIESLGKLLKREKEARLLVERLKRKLKHIRPLRVRPRVVYEVMQNPYLLAGSRNIVADIVEKAGGVYLIRQNRKFVRLSCERARLLRPDIYIYQVGPMNRNPVYPLKRPCFKGMDFEVLKVDELSFARANTKSFDNVIYLNRIFLNWERKVGR